MKTNFSFLKPFAVAALTTVITLSSFGQSGPKWSTDGNPGAYGNWIGTTNAFPFVVKTNNTE